MTYSSVHLSELNTGCTMTRQAKLQAYNRGLGKATSIILDLETSLIQSRVEAPQQERFREYLDTALNAMEAININHPYLW